MQLTNGIKGLFFALRARVRSNHCEEMVKLPCLMASGCCTARAVAETIVGQPNMTFRYTNQSFDLGQEQNIQLTSQTSTVT